MAVKSDASTRVRTHIEKLRQAGRDTEAFFLALVDIRDDPGLRAEEREALYRLVGSESYLWYVEAVEGRPVNRFELAEAALLRPPDAAPTEES